MRKIKIITIFMIPISMVSQNITGIVYDSESTVNGAKISNISNKAKTYTDNNGNFNIQASINDTLIVSSLFHIEKKVTITKAYFDNKSVIELKKTINNLDEVLITKNMEVKEFNGKTYTADLKMQIQNDIKNNPHLYGINPSYNLDFIKIASLIGKLFRKNKKTAPIIAITYKDLDSLFSYDSFFNNQLLKGDLKISEAHKPLFFDYCEAQNIDNKLLLKDNQLLFLNNLMTCSIAFLAFISDYENNQVKD